MAKLMLWLAAVATVVAVGVSLEPEIAEAPTAAVLSGKLNVTGVGQLNGTTNPPTLCGSKEKAKLDGCGYLTPNPRGNLTIANVTTSGNLSTTLSEVLAGKLNVSGVGQINGTTNPATVCVSLEKPKVDGCLYLTPNPHTNFSIANVTIISGFLKSTASSLLSGKLNVTGVVQINGTTNPHTLCVSLDNPKADGCAYLIPNPHFNLTVLTFTLSVLNITTPLDPNNLP